MAAPNGQYAARPRSGGGLIAAGVVIALLGLLAAVGIILAPAGSLPFDKPSQNSPAALAQVPPEATECTVGGPIGGVAKSYSGSQVTSCGFAEAMRRAYGGQSERGAEVQLTVNSPVSQQDYDMTCVGSQVITCTGGESARIYLELTA